MPALELQLIPHLSCEAANHSLHVRMLLQTPALAEHDALFHHVLCRGPTKTQQYTTEDIRVRDSLGCQVRLRSQDSKDGRHRTFHATPGLAAGELTVEYEATPWNPTETSPCGPQIALERDGGGLTAAGMGFILRPAEKLGELVEAMNIEWKLDHTPADTRAVCSLGEGAKVASTAKPSTLDECFFAVGPIQSYPPLEVGTSLTQRGSSHFGMYWLETPNFDAPELGRKMKQLFPKMASFFHDHDATYRIFVRHNVQKCISGRGLHRGFVFAWTKIAPRDPDCTDEFLMHETVHNWPRLGHSPGGPTMEEMADGWFNEGIAEYYSLILPYRFGIFTEQEFVRRLNIRISGYYTNPDRHVKNKDVMGLFWKSGHANQIPYQRGFMYFLQLAYKLKMAGTWSLDDLILKMVDLRNCNEPHGIAVWLNLVEGELDAPALEDYRSMSDANPIVLPPDYLQVVEGIDYKIERQDQEEFCLGFSEDSLRAKPAIVKDLDPESRAAQAGVKEGDLITPRYSFFSSSERWGQTFSMTIIREEGSDGPRVLSWSPRSWNKVESYQFAQGMSSIKERK